MSKRCFDFLAVFLIGIVIKLMDDKLDDEPQSLSLLLGSAIVPYTILLTALSHSMNWQYALSLFCASYTCGMAGSLSRRLPTSLRGWQEGLLLMAVCLWLVGFTLSLAAFLIILVIQIQDDILDYRSDIIYNRSNIVFKLGGIGSVMVATLCFVWALYLDIYLVIYSVISLPVVQGVVKWGSRKLDARLAGL